jgi:hypothetical protein
MKRLAELSEIDSIHYFLKQSIQQLQQLHTKGLSHGGITPLSICVESPYEIIEDITDTIYASPEIALSIAISENYKPEEAVRMWKRDSRAMEWIEKWFPAVAEGYTSQALQKLIGTPLPEQQSDVWSLGISYLSVYDALHKDFPEKDLFLETIAQMISLRNRTLPSVHSFEESVETVVVETVVAVPAVRPSARLTLAEPIRRGARNKTRKNLCN